MIKVEAFVIEREKEIGPSISIVLSPVKSRADVIRQIAYLGLLQVRIGDEMERIAYEPIDVIDFAAKINFDEDKHG